jgi:hypothetical protein
MMDPLRLASLSRIAPWVAYPLAVVVVGAMIFVRETPPVPMAAHDLGRNRQLVAGDLETSNIKPLLGQYLKSDVRAGSPVTKDMVDSKPLQPPIPSTMAALVTIPLSWLKTNQFAVGGDAQICLKSGPFGDATKILTIDCDERVCMVLLKMPNVAHPATDAEISGAQLLAAPATCPPQKP